MVKFNWLGEIVREKDEWRCATMDNGGQCVLIMAGIKWLLILSVVSLDTTNPVSLIYVLNSMCCQLVIYHCPSKGLALNVFGRGSSPLLFNNISCNKTHSMLFQCIDVQNIAVYNCSENNTAGVICGMPSPNVTISMSITSVRFVYTCIKYKPNDYFLFS